MAMKIQINGERRQSKLLLPSVTAVRNFEEITLMFG